MDLRDVQPMPEVGGEYTEVKLGFGLRGVFRQLVERPTFYWGRVNAAHQLGREDWFPVPKAKFGHYHILPVQGRGQIPFVGQPGKTLPQIALAHLSDPDWFRYVLPAADAADIANDLPDAFIIDLAARVEAHYGPLSA